MIFFVSDTHFNHANIIRYCNRIDPATGNQFVDANTMNECMVDNWNAVVGEHDTVYHMGDFGFGNVRDVVRKLNGKITLLVGSHDKNSVGCRDVFDRVIGAHRQPGVLEIRVEDQEIVLSHYCYSVWPKSHYNSWLLFGHSHGGYTQVGKCLDVGVDTNNFTPLSFEVVREIMLKLPDNPNLVSRRR